MPHGLNPSHPERKRDQVLLPPLTRGGQRDARQRNKMDQKLHKFPAHLDALDIKDAQEQRDPGIEQLGGMRTSQLIMRACD